MQVDAKRRQTFTGSKFPADSPNFVELPGSAVKDKNDNGKKNSSKLYIFETRLSPEAIGTKGEHSKESVSTALLTLPRPHRNF